MFIEPGQDLSHDSPDYQRFIHLNPEELRSRWLSDRGCTLFQTLNLANFSSQSIKENIGKLNGKYDLRGISIPNGKNLDKSNFSNIDFFSSSMKNCSLQQCDFSFSYLSECNIEGAVFDWSIMNQTFFDNVKFDLKTSFIGINLNQINSNLAILLLDQAKFQQRVQGLKEKHPLASWILKVTCFYGQSLSLWAFWVLAVIFFFSTLFWFFPNFIKGHDRSFLDCLYFSFVTFTTLGYGDIIPNHYIGKLCAMIEVSLGYVMGGLLIAILSKKIWG